MTIDLNAKILCRCFEEGKIKDSPIPVDDLFIDDGGDVLSRKLEFARKKYNHRQYVARYSKLENDFFEWKRTRCKHEDGVYYSDWVDSARGLDHFRFLVTKFGGVDVFPLLSKLLPEGLFGGSYPVELAAETLKELDKFIVKVPDVEAWVLCDLETGREIWTSMHASPCSRDFTKVCSFSQEDAVGTLQNSVCRKCSFPRMMSDSHGHVVGMVENKVFIAGPHNSYIETNHFKQIPIDAKDSNGFQKLKIVCQDCGAEIEIYRPIWPICTIEAEREFRVVSKRGAYLHDGKYWPAERIRGLLQASIECGNPIRWC